VGQTLHIDVEQLLDIHAEIMTRLGLPPQSLLREGDLRSALSRPQWAAHYENADIVTQAARLTTGIARPRLVDGNKRTAYAALLVFLGLNGLQIIGRRFDIGPLLVELAGPAVGDAEADRRMEAFLRQRVTTS
jgi:death-on-curing protein